MKAVADRAAAHGPVLDYGLRMRVILRATGAEARDYAEHLVSKPEDEHGRKIRERAQDSISPGVAHQARNRELADKNSYVEPHRWTGIARSGIARSGIARSGCGAALVGSADQVLSGIEACRKRGIRAFILSGYPHLDEGDQFGRRVLPRLTTRSLPHEFA